MVSPSLLNTESERVTPIKTLGLLDTYEEQRFDRLVRMAKNMFDVPIAVVSLVEQSKQLSKSHLELDLKKDIAISEEAKLQDKTCIVEDTSKDTRFLNNPVVVNKPNIRFYAGCPLKVHGNHIGTLSIADVGPRKMDHSKIELLEDLAVMIENELTAIQMATTDELTQIPNRRGFYTLVEKGIKICSRRKVTSSLAIIDLNGFKKINDTMGHQTGDHVLKEFAKLLQSSVRETDIVSRLSGDEFVVWYNDASKEKAVSIVSRLKDLATEHNKSQKIYTIKFSVGIIEIKPDNPASLDEIINTADVLMYKDKYSA
jgi:diguanylate cyclase (GGDEF)-like protein